MSPFAQTLYSKFRFGGWIHWTKIHVAVLNIITGIVALVLCGTYIVQVNATAAKGYTIRELETRIHDASLVNQQLEIDAQRAQSMANVMRSVQMLGMVEAQTPTYVKGTEPTYVLAR